MLQLKAKGKNIELPVNLFTAIIFYCFSNYVLWRWGRLTDLEVFNGLLFYGFFPSFTSSSVTTSPNRREKQNLLKAIVELVEPLAPSLTIFICMYFITTILHDLRLLASHEENVGNYRTIFFIVLLLVQKL